MRSMRMSSTARCWEASGYFSFQRVRPASAANLSVLWETMMRGCLGVRFVVFLRVLADGLWRSDSWPSGLEV